MSYIETSDRRHWLKRTAAGALVAAARETRAIMGKSGDKLRIIDPHVHLWKHDPAYPWASDLKEPPKFIALGAAEAIAERNPIYESTEIKAGAFGGSPPRPEESVETIEVHHYFAARKSLSEEVVADFTKHLFASRQALTAELPGEPAL